MTTKVKAVRAASRPARSKNATSATGAKPSRKRTPPAVWELGWRCKFLTTDAKDIVEMAYALHVAAGKLYAMAASGVTLLDDGGVEDDYATLVTTDPKVAKKFGFQPVTPDGLD